MRTHTSGPFFFRRYIPEKLQYPPLSLLGFKPGTEERSTYLFGFTAVLVLFLGMVRTTH